MVQQFGKGNGKSRAKAKVGVCCCGEIVATELVQVTSMMVGQTQLRGRVNMTQNPATAWVNMGLDEGSAGSEERPK